jgi:lincosamide nucleotidyltransferase A/C/D/E
MMETHDVLAIADSLSEAQIPFWLDGGWGIDALVGQQTRPHDDLDLVIELADSDRAAAALSGLGYTLYQDERPTKFVLRDERDHRVDFHTVTFDAEGGGVQVLQDGSSYRYPPEGFKARGTVGGQSVACLSAEVQVECHMGYESDANDFHDMRMLHRHLGIELPPPFN